MNYLIVQQHNQNIQMRSQNLMLKHILATVGVNALLHNPYVSDIAYLTNIHLTSTFDMTHPIKYEHFFSHLPPKKEVNNELVPYKKDLMSLISSVILNCQSGRPKLIQIFLF